MDAGSTSVGVQPRGNTIVVLEYTKVLSDTCVTSDLSSDNR